MRACNEVEEEDEALTPWYSILLLAFSGPSSVVLIAFSCMYVNVRSCVAICTHRIPFPTVVHRNCRLMHAIGVIPNQEENSCRALSTEY